MFVRKAWIHVIDMIRIYHIANVNANSPHCSKTSGGLSMDATSEDPTSKNRNEVWRRYSEFEVLRNFLSVAYPFIVIPPLPEKAVSLRNTCIDLLDKYFFHFIIRKVLDYSFLFIYRSKARQDC